MTKAEAIANAKKSIISDGIFDEESNSLKLLDIRAGITHIFPLEPLTFDEFVDRLYQWKEERVVIQKAFPMYDLDRREILRWYDKGRVTMTLSDWMSACV